jgi:hypothetical protein
MKKDSAKSDLTRSSRSTGLLWGGILGALSTSLVWAILQQTDRLRRSTVAIQGAGNSGNRIYLDPVRDELAAAIAAHAQTAAITDEELAATVEAIRRRAGKGNLQAALVLFRIAEMQRSKK